MPETSVIIPTFNRLAFLKDAIDSVLQQTYRDFELIVVDDGSTDGTQAYLHSLGNVLQIIYQEKKGPGAARNCGIERSSGEYITFLDSDDLWQKNKLAVQVEVMKATDAMVSYTDEIWIRRGVRVNPKNKHRKYSGWIFEHCLPLCIVSPSSVLMKRDFFDVVVGMFDESFPVCEDYDLWLRASLIVPFLFIDKKLIVKRGGHADQLSANWGFDIYRVRALQKILAQANLNAEQKALTIGNLVEKCRILESGFRKHGKFSEAETYQKILTNYV